MTTRTKKLLIIDANALVHRTFHALPPLSTQDGKPVGALYGLANVLIKVLKQEHPDYVIAAFDTPEPTFRKKMFADYKAHRPKTPDELISQLIESRVLFNKIGIVTIEQPGFEADDLIGSLVERFGSTKNLQITILTGDLDALQLVSGDDITVLTFKKGVSQTITYDERQVVERYGIKPEQLVDYKGLVGDPSDNIPGVPGIGPKTATQLLKEYHSIEKTYANIKKIKSAATVKKLTEHKEQAFLSKQLAIIRRDVPCNVSLIDISYTPSYRALIPYLKKLEFFSLIVRLTSTNYKNFKPKKAVMVVGKTVTKKILRSAEIKVAFQWKPILKQLKQIHDIATDSLFDTAIAGWLLDPDKKITEPELFARRWLGRVPKKKVEFLSELYNILTYALHKERLENIFWNIEMPIIPVLADMEQYGITINTPALKKLRLRATKKLELVAKKIHSLTNVSFNISSPKQVGEVLFETLGVPYTHSKTPSGQYRTSEEILADITTAHPVVPLITEHRELSKLLSTYIEPVLEKTDTTGRVHTSFLQTSTATGRLSSENPNLQNIPKTSKWAKPLRACFIAMRGYHFVSFDYSQIELRILAHVTKDPNLTQVFHENKDIHTLTAARVLGIPLRNVGEKERALAKTLNFGVIYGMGARAFSKTSGLTLDKSKQFIEKYFDDFPSVREWQEHTIQEALSSGYVTNINGRKRWFTRMPPHMIKRAAINMPIQSLGADIMKLSMRGVYDLLHAQNWHNTVHMVLTIHDELLLEVADDMLNIVIPQIQNTMENIYQLSAPLRVEVTHGATWSTMQPFSHL